MNINYTWPGRFHLIYKKKETFYITLWFFKWRFHKGPDLGIQHGWITTYEDFLMIMDGKSDKETRPKKKGKCKSIIDWHNILNDLDERGIKYEPRIWYHHVTDFNNYEYEILFDERSENED